MADRKAARRLLGTISLAVALYFAGPTAVAAQMPDVRPSLAERLGYAPDAKLVILHADDLGMTHSVNRASLHLMRTGRVSSGSVMVPAPWFPEVAAVARENPHLDLGLHLTLTSEWPNYRWGPILPITQVPSLVDSTGFLYATANEAAQRMDPGQVEAEIRAQVDRAIAFGVRPTHLDSHMGTLFATPELFEAYLRVGRDYRIPVLVPADALQEQASQLIPLLQPKDIVIDHLRSIPPGVPGEEWDDYYVQVIGDLKPGVTEIIIHAAYDDHEMRAAAGDGDWGASWRQRDLDVFANPALGQRLLAHGVRLVTWREIGALLKER
jgi:hypothetical protein